jgi:hypothetical protein
MSNLTISIFGNKIFLEIINEIKIFSKFNVKYYEDFDLCIKEAEVNNFLAVFFINEKNKNILTKNKIKNFPTIFIAEPSILKNFFFNEFNEKLSMPFFIKDFEKKLFLLWLKMNLKKIH